MALAGFPMHAADPGASTRASPTAKYRLRISWEWKETFLKPPFASLNAVKLMGARRYIIIPASRRSSMFKEYEGQP
jgi:hypothetical protein